ncbi:hypothetical protein [Kingella potus]|uniref:hypothetical protein n=1 Tax=Kingella potus TaxID=265175 RepID=UPI001FD136B0|nr:hypothetical protein [Kingella potus]UOP01638.1 hypothetical protein LVJ84_05640 [Kingella potus]
MPYAKSRCCCRPPQRMQRPSENRAHRFQSLLGVFRRPVRAAVRHDDKMRKEHQK